MVQIQVEHGWLEGAELDVVTGERKYFSFKGVPYAAPPVGRLRFMAPRPLLPWKGIRKATEHGPVPPQDDIVTRQFIPGSEDCLYLNVYSPNMNPEKLLPVMVHIHSGGFKSGSGNDDLYGPDFLMNHGVVLVTINYRLDVLGFLCLDTKEVPGNAGLKDQVAALKWIQNNIQQFGGDPTNVTIFGDSAGGSSVTLHLLSPASKGLFKRAIAMSGSSLCDWSFTFEPKRRAFKLAKELGLETDDPNEVLEFLQNIPTEKLVGTNQNILMSDSITKVIAKVNPFAPVIEKDFGGEHFLTEELLELMKKGSVNAEDFMMGYTKNEIITFIWYIEDILSVYDDYPIELVPACVKYQNKTKTCLEYADKIKKHFFKNKSITKGPIENFIKYNNQAIMEYGVHSFLRYLTRTNRCKNYLYRFLCKSERNVFSKMGEEKYNSEGPSHLDDLMYLFYAKGPQFCVPADKRNKSYELIQMMCKIYTNFAKYGNPTPDESLGATWPVYDNDTMSYLDIDAKLTPGAGLGKDVLEFWDDIYRGVFETT